MINLYFLSVILLFAMRTSYIDLSLSPTNTESWAAGTLGLRFGTNTELLKCNIDIQDV
jgi:hypothetical protein